ncbi:MAG TPA: oligoendopeptidase F, partial [Chondromyces sp.]|nr:oligoendopeptidase F [Chondromyces sp.]
KPVYTKREEIPQKYKWDLTELYSNEDAWRKDYKKIKKLAAQFYKKQGKLGTSDKNLLKAISDYEELSRKFEKVFVYAKLAHDTDLSNPAAQETAGEAESLLAYVNEKTSWFVPELTQLPEKRIKKLLKKEGSGPYKRFIKEVITGKPHTLPQRTEKILAQLSPLNGIASNVYGMLSKDLSFPQIKDKGGKQAHLAQANYASFLENPDREIRKEAFESYYKTIGQYEDTFAALLKSEVQSNNIGARIRKYDSALQSSLESNEVPEEVYGQLIHTVNEHLPLLHRYLTLKKEILGLEGFHMYDVHAPIVDVQSEYIPFDEAAKMVKEGLEPLGKEYTKTVEKAFQNNWVDVYPTAGKRSGAYQWGAFDSHPYLLLNYHGTYDDVLTIAHEFGHAMHSYYSNKNQSYLNAGYPIFTAEVASTLNEHIMFQHVYNQARTKNEKLYLLHQYLENFRGTLFRQAQLAEFEKIIHELDQQGQPLTAEVLKEQYLALNKKYYGKPVISDKAIALEWARVPHFYRNFYVYQYATSFAASAALAKQVMEEGTPAVERIRDQLLAAGDSKPPLEVLKSAGVDMSTSKPLAQAMDLFEERLNEFEKLIKEEKVQ